MPTKEPNPLLRPLLALAELLVRWDDPKPHDDLAAKEQDQRVKSTFIAGFRREQPYDDGITKWETLQRLEEEVTSVLCGGVQRWQASSGALTHASNLAEALVARVFNIRGIRLEEIAPAATAASRERAKKLRAEAQAKRKADDKAKRARAQKKTSKKVPAKKTAKKPAKTKAPSSAQRNAWQSRAAAASKAASTKKKTASRKASAKANGAPPPDPRQTSLVDDAGARA